MFSVKELLILSQIPGIGANRLRNLVCHFGTPEAALRASARELVQVEGFSRKLATSVVHHLRGGGEEATRFAEQQLSRLNKAGGHLLTFWDKGYPEILRMIYDPPPFLFVLGALEPSDRFAVAIVGTRSPTEYGVASVDKFCRDLAILGIPVVSGLARGVDTAAHTSILRHGGRTLAVIGSGIDVIYPPENRYLSARIARRGAILSEYPMGTKPDAVNFPRRNRIISGLTLGTLIVETDLNGGAMITASTALDQNREVFALPGPISSKRSRGCHALIKDGKAKLVENTDDLLAELSEKLRPVLRPPAGERQIPLPSLTLFERNLFDLLTGEPTHIDALAERSQCSISDALVMLLSLEFKGVVKQLPGKMFVRR